MPHDVFRSDAFFGFFQQAILYAVDKKKYFRLMTVLLLTIKSCSKMIFHSFCHSPFTCLACAMPRQFLSYFFCSIVLCTAAATVFLETDSAAAVFH